jgi:GT2 family glycosyltransferase
MTGGPAISIVVPAFRTAHVLADLLDSVLAQTHTDWELVVVDDCSPDHLDRVVAPYLTDPRVRLVRLPQNRGVSGARNEGLARSTGSLVAFIDSDDVLGPDFLELLAAAVARTPAAGIVGFLPVVTDAHGAPSSIPGVDAPYPEDPADTEGWLQHLLRTPFHFRGTTVPRAVLEETGGFDETLWLGEDLELWIRVVLTGRPVAVVDAPAYVHRLLEGSLTRQPEKTVERSLAHLRALERIEAQLGPASERTEALEVARRRPRALEATGRYRHAVRAGDGRAARRHARTIVALDPGRRSRLLWAVAQLPAPLVRAGYAVKRRRPRAAGPSGS